MKLADALPELVSDLEGALLPIGRGDLLKQLQDAALERWSYDDFSDTAYLYLTAEPFERLKLDTLSLYDELGVNLETDDRGRICGVEIMDGKAIVSRLDAAGAR
jgi:uncharacterized protein YuzE